MHSLLLLLPLLLLPLLLPLLVLGSRYGPLYTEIYSDVDQTGNATYFESGTSELETYDMNDDIESVIQTGMWMYYENENWNLNDLGSVYYAHGIDITVIFPEEYQNIVSSFRYSGSYMTLNEDTITFFEGTGFAGWGYVATANDSTFYPLQVSGNVSSMIVTGSSPWTVYTEQNYTGSSWCVTSTEQDVSDDGTTFDVGIYPSVEEIGIPDNSIWSVIKGCSAARVAEAPKLQVDGRQQNGAWGRLV